MPPMFLYHAATKSVELVVMKGMPLGGFERFPYQSRELQLEHGDTLLLMSDGYLEMFNEEGETLDELRAVAAFKQVAERNPKEIIESLIREGKKWANGRPQADDVTFVAMKFNA
jgi:serine phosphatase RsbU (regulator of sigma subunit)